ncbi:hypothetical protein P3L56_15390 [Providencia sp. PROV024]|nr:hypothetical protein P3L56_15390 [Providencia sp. PROV024]
MEKTLPNLSATLISGAASVFLAEWSFIIYGIDFSSLKPLAFASLPVFALSLSYGIRKLWLIKKVGASQRGILSESDKTIKRIKNRLKDKNLPPRVKEMLENELLIAMQDDILLSKASMTALRKDQEGDLQKLEENPPQID